MDTGMIDPASSSGIFSTTSHLVSDQDTHLNELFSNTASDNTADNFFGDNTEDTHLFSALSSSSINRRDKNLHNIESEESRQNQIFDLQMQEQLNSIKNIHTKEEIQDLFGSESEDVSADLLDIIKMKMVPIMKLDSSINFNSDSYDYESSSSQPGELSQKDLEARYARFSQELADYDDIEHSMLSDLKNAIKTELSQSKDSMDGGKKFLPVNGNHFGIPAYLNPSNMLPPANTQQNQTAVQDKVRQQSDAYKTILAQIQANNRTLHFPTCYNDPETQSAFCNKPVVVVIAVLLALICVASISGNFLVLLVIAKSSRLRKPPSVFKVSLAIADLLLSLFVIPSLLYNLFKNVLIPENPVYTLTDFVTNLNGIPDWIPRTVGSASLISMTASILTLLVMSVDRLVAIRWPIYHRIHNSCNRASCSIVIIWVISLIPTIIMNVSKNIEWHLEVHTMTFSPTFYNTVDDSIFNPLPLKSRVFGISYCLVYWVLPWILTTFLTIGVGFYGWKSLKSIKTVPKQRIRAKISDTSQHTAHTHQTEDSTAKIIVSMHDEPSTDTTVSGVSNVSDASLTSSASMNHTNGSDTRKVIRKTEGNKNEDSSKRLVKTLTILVIMYTICTLPLTILQLYMWINDDTAIGGDSFRWLWFLASFLYLAQSAMNIFIYHRSKEFSEALKSLYGAQRTSVYNTSGSYRNTLRTNLASKVRVFKQATLTTSDGGHRISTIAEASGNNYSRVFVDKGHIISKLNVANGNIVIPGPTQVNDRTMDRLAVYNIDMDSNEFVSPPPKMEQDVKMAPPAILRVEQLVRSVPPCQITNNFEDQQQTVEPTAGPCNDNASIHSVASSGNGHTRSLTE